MGASSVQDHTVPTDCDGMMPESHRHRGQRREGLRGGGELTGSIDRCEIRHLVRLIHNKTDYCWLFGRLRMKTMGFVAFVVIVVIVVV